MGLLCVFLIVSCLASVISSENLPFSQEELKAIQERLDRLQLLETFLSLILDSGTGIEARKDVAEREEKCLPIGAECAFFSGPKCCSIRTRCVVWDRTEGTDGRGMLNGFLIAENTMVEVWLDNIYQFFKNLG
uniref:BLTX604 n=1 Tax=Nephila pilipes TaxID=299642 RepID=A0A076L0J8_NEPPI|nr:BLTX604 [Nephila pilipes]